MISKKFIKFKQKFIDVPVEHFGYVTFGELGIGDKFIIFPLPAATTDGGFKGSSGLLRKMKDTVQKGAKKSGIAFSMIMNKKRRIRNSLPVIRIITKEI